jgi:uncharacterized protein YeaO (DUF488 family)
MAVRIVKLGSLRGKDEGLRIGTVRRPPRGVPKAEFARRDWYDVWLPNLSPSEETLRLAHRAKTPAQWQDFFRAYRAEMARPENIHLIETLSALSQQTDFAVGCYCEDEEHCHRSALRELLRKKGAVFA